RLLFDGTTPLFPGFAGLALALLALSWGRGIRDARIRMAAAIGVLGVAFSFGPALPGYGFLHEHVPLLSGIRNAARWGWLALAAVAMLAGFSVAELERRRKGSFAWIGVALCALVTVEAIRTPVGYAPFNGFPTIYDRIAAEPNAIIAEFPFFAGGNVNLNGPYVLGNVRYFKPLVNGYSGFQTRAFEERGKNLITFPSELALAEL